MATTFTDGAPQGRAKKGTKAVSSKGVRRAERDQIAGNTGVLDLFQPPVPAVVTDDALHEVLGLSREQIDSTLRHIRLRHGDELRADGWDEVAGTFTRRAVIRIACMLRPSTSARAARIAKAAKAASRVMSFNHNPRSPMCGKLLDEALRLAEQVRDDDPGETWAALRRWDRHKMQGMLVTLAALVDVEKPGATRYLRSLGGGDSVAGLGRLVPTRETTDGLPLSVLDAIAAEDEDDSEAADG